MFKAISLLVIFFITIHSAPISQLPGYDGPALSMDSGYITVDSKNGRNLFYWLIEAESDADNKPIVVWFQGGPGCSGLGGLFSENGPLNIKRDQWGQTQPVYNNLAWTKFANMLYIEQPAFVGYSYSLTQSDRNTGDAKAAADNYKFLQLFMQQFPKYATRDLWFTGESYGGVYVPTLTSLVLNDIGSPIYDQFQGFMIGNPVFSCQGGVIGSTGPYQVEMMGLIYWHGLVSFTNYQNWTNYGCNDASVAGQPACQWILNNALNQIGIIDQELKSEDAQLLTQLGYNQVNVWPSLDPDDLYQDFCTGNGTLEFSVTPPPVDNCDSIGSLIQEYLNRADVQTAVGAIPSNWTECTNNINYNISGASMNPLYESFFTLKPGVKILVYSGDIDILTVPFPFTQPCIAQLGGSIISAWQPWFVNGATAGYVEQYDKYTYATVKGAGHETPQFQPLTAYHMIDRFMKHGTLNDPSEEKLRKQRRRNQKGKRTLKQSDLLRAYGMAPNLKRSNN